MARDDIRQKQGLVQGKTAWQNSTVKYRTHSVASYDIFSQRRPKNLDLQEARVKFKMIHILVQHGGKCIPVEEDEMSHARRSLLRMTPDYASEFVWIMSKYQGCSRKNMDSLLCTPSIREHVSSGLERLNELLATLADG